MPKIVIAPTITGASLGFKNNREDKHKVIIAFALKDDPVFAAERTVQRDFVVASGNPTEQRAVDAVDRFIRRTELGRTSIIIDGSTVIP